MGLFWVVKGSKEVDELCDGDDFPEFEGCLRWLLWWRGDGCLGVGGTASTAIFFLHITTLDYIFVGSN